MGILDVLLNAASRVADSGANYVEKKTNEYASGYERGRNKASSMSDSELRSELQRAKENGISGMGNAGKTRAMMDEYQSRKK